MGKSHSRRTRIETLEPRVLLSYPAATNDNFADAALLEGTQASGSAAYAGATIEPGEPGVGQVEGDVTLWWKWTAPEDGLFAIDYAGSSRPPGITVYTGNSLAELSEVRPTSERVRFATAGTTYHIQASTVLISLHDPEAPIFEEDGFQLHLSQTSAIAPKAESLVRTSPNRDPFIFTADLFTGSFVKSHDMPLTSIVLGRISGDRGDISLRLHWAEAPRLGLYFKGALASASTEIPVAEISDLMFYPADSETSYISFGWWGSNGLRWSMYVEEATIRLPFSQAPANDDWANRTLISGDNVSVDVNVVGATTEPGETNVDTSGTVWYEWTASADGYVQFSSSSQYIIARIYDGSPFTPGTFESEHDAWVTAGHTYSISVSHGPIGVAADTFTSQLIARQKLSFAGTPCDDEMSVTVEEGTVRVRINDQVSEHRLNSIAAIILRSGEGDDRISIGPGIAFQNRFFSLPPRGVEVYAGSGDDTITCGSVSDTVRAGRGNDVIYSGDGSDSLYGGMGDDLLFGGAGGDELFGGDGNDVLRGGGDDDAMNGDAGDDTIYGGMGRDYIKAGQGNDRVYGKGGNDNLRGGWGNDELNGDAGVDLIHGGPGDDYIRAGEGKNLVYGRDGNDTILGGTGIDTIGGGPGNDTIYATANSRLTGGLGDDVLNRVEDGSLIPSDYEVILL